MSDPITPEPADAIPIARRAILNAIFEVTHRSRDLNGRLINILDRVADEEGVVGIVVGIADRSVVLQVEHGFAAHAADSLFATAASTVHVLRPFEDDEAFMGFVRDLRSKADGARAEHAEREVAEPVVLATLNRPREIGSRVYIRGERLFGRLLLLDEENEQAVMFTDVEADSDYAGFMVFSYSDCTVTDDEPLPRDEVVKLVANYIPGLSTDADAEPSATLPAFGENAFRQRIPDGSYVFHVEFKATAYVMFGTDECLVVRSVSSRGPSFIDVWDAAFVVVLNLAPVDREFIEHEIYELMSQPNVGDAAGKMNGTAPGRIVLVLAGTAIVHWPGNAAMKPRFEAVDLHKSYTPPFRQYSAAEVRQIIRSHQQLEDAPLAGGGAKAEVA